jgi:hypothetical protein
LLVPNSWAVSISRRAPLALAELIGIVEVEQARFTDPIPDVNC